MISPVFIAQAFGMDLSLGAQLGIIATATQLKKSSCLF